MGEGGGIVRLGLGVDADPLFADLIAAIGEAARELGIEPVEIRSPADLDRRSIDRLILVGRPGRFRTLLSSDARPPTLVWTGEPLPAPPGQDGAGRRRRRPAFVRRLARPFGSAARSVRLPGPLDRRRIAVTTDRLTRTNLDELAFASACGAELVVTSRDRLVTLTGWGLTARVVPFGYHHRHAGPLTPADAGPRDVPLLLLGARATHTRRAAAVDRLRVAGAPHGLAVEEASWGAHRDALLRRTRVMLDVHRVPGNFIGLRMLLSLAAGVALVTEEITDPWPYVP